MKKFLVFALIVASTSVYADWSKVTFNDTTTMLIDSETIKRSGDLVQVSQMMNFPLGERSPDGKLSYKSSITTEEYDCKKGLSRTLGFKWYSEVMGKGRMVYQDNHTYDFIKFVDGSLLNAVKKQICGR